MMTDSNLAFGPYEGFGSISDNGRQVKPDHPLHAVINDRCYAQAGGGIVVDSTPEYEYNENKIKAQALLDLLYDPSMTIRFLHPQPRALLRIDEVLVLDRREINDEACQKADLIVLSPGPGNPDQYPETQALCRAWTGQKPILGVCLGFQLVLQLEGARIIRQSQVLHGVETEIDFDPFSETYSGLDQALRVARYHSLRVDPAS